MSDNDFANLLKGAFLAVRAASIDGSLPDVTVQTPDGKTIEDNTSLGDIDDAYIGDISPENYVGDIIADNGWTGDDMLLKFVALFEPLAYKGIYKVSETSKIAYPTHRHHLIFNLPIASALIKKMKGGGSNVDDVLPYKTLYIWDNPSNTQAILKLADKLGVTLENEKDHKSPSIAAPNALKAGAWKKRLDNMVCYSGKFSPALASHVTAFVVFADGESIAPALRGSDRTWAKFVGDNDALSAGYHLTQVGSCGNGDPEIMGDDKYYYAPVREALDVWGFGDITGDLQGDPGVLGDYPCVKKVVDTVAPTAITALTVTNPTVSGAVAAYGVVATALFGQFISHSASSVTDLATNYLFGNGTCDWAKSITGTVNKAAKTSQTEPLAAADVLAAFAPFYGAALRCAFRSIGATPTSNLDLKNTLFLSFMATTKRIPMWLQEIASSPDKKFQPVGSKNKWALGALKRFTNPIGNSPDDAAARLYMSPDFQSQLEKATTNEQLQALIARMGKGSLAEQFFSDLMADAFATANAISAVVKLASSKKCDIEASGYKGDGTAMNFVQSYQGTSDQGSGDGGDGGGSGGGSVNPTPDNKGKEEDHKGDKNEDHDARSKHHVVIIDDTGSAILSDVPTGDYSKYVRIGEQVDIARRKATLKPFFAPVNATGDVYGTGFLPLIPLVKMFAKPLLKKFVAPLAGSLLGKAAGKVKNPLLKGVLGAAANLIQPKGQAVGSDGEVVRPNVMGGIMGAAMPGLGGKLISGALGAIGRAFKGRKRILQNQPAPEDFDAVRQSAMYSNSQSGYIPQEHAAMANRWSSLSRGNVGGYYGNQYSQPSEPSYGGAQSYNDTYPQQNYSNQSQSNQTQSTYF